MRLAQDPDRLIIDGHSLRYHSNGYSFIEYQDKLYIGTSGQSHDDLLTRLNIRPKQGYYNLPSGRIFIFKGYTIITTWLNNAFSKDFFRRLLKEFKYTTTKVLYEIWDIDHKDGIFIPFDQLPNNYKDFKTIAGFESYLQKKKTSSVKHHPTDINMYRMKDMKDNPTLYFGKMQQTPDHVVVDGKRIGYDYNGYPFLWKDGVLYISDEQGLGHSDYMEELEQSVPGFQYGTNQKGRVFTYKNYLIMSIWKQSRIDKSMLDDVAQHFKGQGEMFYEIYDWGNESSIIVPYNSLPKNISDFNTMDAYKRYIQKVAKSKSARNPKNAYYNIQMAKAQDIMKNPELYFGKLKQYTKRIKEQLNYPIQQSGNSPLDRLKWQASHDGYEAKIVRARKLNQSTINIYCTEDLDQAYGTDEQRAQYLKNTKTSMKARQGFKFLYLPQTNVGVIPKSDDDTFLYIFENPGSVCDF